jgi:hypothetical protein
MSKLYCDVRSIKSLVNKFLKLTKDSFTLSYLEKKGMFTIFSWNKRVPENFQALITVLVKSSKKIKLGWKLFLRVISQAYGYLLVRKIHWEYGQNPELNEVKRALRDALKIFDLHRCINIK